MACAALANKGGISLIHTYEAFGTKMYGALRQEIIFASHCRRVGRYAMINTYWEDLPFTLQEGHAGEWHRVIDTSLESPDDFCALGSEVRLSSRTYIVKARSVVRLMRS